MDEIAAHSEFWGEKEKKGDKVSHPFTVVTVILTGDENNSRLRSAYYKAQETLCLLVWRIFQSILAI